MDLFPAEANVTAVLQMSCCNHRSILEKDILLYVSMDL